MMSQPTQIWNHSKCQARGPIGNKRFAINYLWDKPVYCPYCGELFGRKEVKE